MISVLLFTANRFNFLHFDNPKIRRAGRQAAAPMCLQFS